MSFTPPRSAIVSITRSLECTVMTEAPHWLTTGQVVRLIVPRSFGMVELNHKIVSVTVLTDVLFTIQETQVPPAINVDSRQFTPFSIPIRSNLTAEVLPIGSGPTPILNPSVYFRNNVCVSKVEDALTNISTHEKPF